jgi:hypothetical protein
MMNSQQKNKFFIITIDTEGDNLWEYRQGDRITTKNSGFIPRFQKLCNQFGFKPVYLTNFEMVKDPNFTGFAKDELKNGNCEIGIHLHAWNNPPLFELPPGKAGYGLPYLIEYPEDIMRAKFSFLYESLSNAFNTNIVSHRSGRWAMNDGYFSLLKEFGIKTDCSVTPHVSWENSSGFTESSVGTDYRNYSEEAFFVEGSGILELPVSIRKLHVFQKVQDNSLKARLSRFKSFVRGNTVWLRPDGKNLDGMFSLVDCIKESNSAYLMFMLHSSELMPGGSPTFKTPESIETLYEHLNLLFEKISPSFQGISLDAFYSHYTARPGTL